MHITQRFILHNKARLLKQSRFFYTGIVKIFEGKTVKYLEKEV